MTRQELEVYARAVGYHSGTTFRLEKKDADRLTTLLSYRKDKWVGKANSMANKITHYDKAYRRALACAEVYANHPNVFLLLDQDRIDEVIDVFFSRFLDLALQNQVISARDIVKFS